MAGKREIIMARTVESVDVGGIPLDLFFVRDFELTYEKTPDRLMIFSKKQPDLVTEVPYSNVRYIQYKTFERGEERIVEVPSEKSLPEAKPVSKRGWRK